LHNSSTYLQINFQNSPTVTSQFSRTAIAKRRYRKEKILKSQNWTIAKRFQKNRKYESSHFHAHRFAQLAQSHFGNKKSQIQTIAKSGIKNRKITPSQIME
jgi:hypothetical protein